MDNFAVAKELQGLLNRIEFPANYKKETGLL
jgi:hypothetical protein